MLEKIVNIIFEWLHLKQIKHEWRRLAWVPNPDSVAEHSLNAAQIGYILAKMEWANPEKVATMLVWHDLWEARVWDSHKVAMRYLEWRWEAEEKALKESVQGLDFWDDIFKLFHEYEYRETLEWEIAKDADYLEQAFMAKYYYEIWYKDCENWIDRIWDHLKTSSAKKIWEQLGNSSFTDWWRKQWLKK